MKTRLVFLSLFVALGNHVMAQHDFSDVEIKTVPVAGNIFMLEGAGGNIGVCAGDEGILIVDDQFEVLAPRIEAAVFELARGGVTYVLNTHLHGDHIGGNPHFSQIGATIVSHHNVRSRLETDTEFSRKGLPVITFSSEAHIHFNGEEIRLLHSGPGHTDGDSIVHFVGADVIHMGDLMFKDQFPYVDLGNGGSIDGYIQSVERALEFIGPNTKIIPGHGSLAGREDLERSLRMMKETSQQVRQAIRRGENLDAIKGAGLSEEWMDWGNEFISTEQWIESLYNDATR